MQNLHTLKFFFKHRKLSSSIIMTITFHCKLTSQRINFLLLFGHIGFIPISNLIKFCFVCTIDRCNFLFIICFLVRKFFSVSCSFRFSSFLSSKQIIEKCANGSKHRTDYTNQSCKNSLARIFFSFFCTRSATIYNRCIFLLICRFFLLCLVRFDKFIPVRRNNLSNLFDCSSLYSYKAVSKLVISEIFHSMIIQ